MRKLLVLGGAFVGSVLVLFAVGYVASRPARGAVRSIVYERRGEDYLLVEQGSGNAPRGTFARLHEFAGRTVELQGYMTPLGTFVGLEAFVLTESRPTGGLERLSLPERTVLVRLPEGESVALFRGVVRAKGTLARRDYEWQGRRIAAWELLADAVLAEVPR